MSCILSVHVICDKLCNVSYHMSYHVMCQQQENQPVSQHISSLRGLGLRWDSQEDVMVQAGRLLNTLQDHILNRPKQDQRRTLREWICNTIPIKSLHNHGNMFMFGSQAPVPMPSGPRGILGALDWLGHILIGGWLNPAWTPIYMCWCQGPVAHSGWWGPWNIRASDS